LRDPESDGGGLVATRRERRMAEMRDPKPANNIKVQEEPTDKFTPTNQSKSLQNHS